MTQQDVSNVSGATSLSSSTHPRKIFVRGLGKIFAEAEVDLRRAELERAFRKYGGALGVHVVIPKNKTFAFVEVESERMTDLALAEMAGTYRLHRAARSRHEALLEERARHGGGWAA